MMLQDELTKQMIGRELERLREENTALKGKVLAALAYIGELTEALERVRAKIYYDSSRGNDFVLVDDETFAMIEKALAAPAGEGG